MARVVQWWVDPARIPELRDSFEAENLPNSSWQESIDDEQLVVNTEWKSKRGVLVQSQMTRFGWSEDAIARDSEKCALHSSMSRQIRPPNGRVRSTDTQELYEFKKTKHGFTQLRHTTQIEMVGWSFLRVWACRQPQRQSLLKFLSRSVRRCEAALATETARPSTTP